MHEVKRQKLDYQEYVNFLNSTDWNKIKGDVMNEIGNECEHCGREFPRRNLRLHHTNYDKEFGFEDLNSGDLILICEECHNEMHQDIECFDRVRFKKRANQPAMKTRELTTDSIPQIS